MSIKYNGKTIIESYGKLRVGDDGNFWVGNNNLGIKAKSDVHAVTEQDFNTCIEPGVYFVIIPDGDTLSLAMYYIDEAGAKRAITNTDYIIETPSDIDAVINDTIIINNATWSSAKIVDYVSKEVDKCILDQPKNLEFKWSGTRLGVRQQGRGDYIFKDLGAGKGLDGIDGSSVVGARLDDNGNLILTMQDTDDAEENSKFVAIENGVFTREDLLSLVNDVKKLKVNMRNIITAPFTEYYAVQETDSAYHDLYTTTGRGTVNINFNQFNGRIKLTIDGTAMETIIDNDNEVASLVKLDTGLFRMVNIADIVSGAFTPDITFKESITISMRVDSRIDDNIPRMMIHGYRYPNE